MRIAILQQSYGRFGGAERLAFSHFTEMRRLRQDVTLFYAGQVSPGWEKRLANEPLERIPVGIERGLTGFGRLFEFVDKLRGFDRIVIHHHVEPLLAFYLSKILGNRIVWYSGSVFELPWQATIMSREIDYRQISPTVRRTSEWFYGSRLSNLLLSDAFFPCTIRAAKILDCQTVKGFRKIIANSIFLSESLCRVYHLKKTPSVVYPGPDPLLEHFAAINHLHELDYMLTVGSLNPLKNVKSMVRAAAAIGSPRMVVVGDGQEKKNLQELGIKLNVPIEFRGTVDAEEELARPYGECKFLVHLSLYEPFGLTPVEAALFSKPSIVTNRGGPPEVVVDGETGFVVDPNDYRLIGSRMNTLLRDDALRREMGRRAKEIVTRKFTLERSTRRLLEEVEA